MEHLILSDVIKVLLLGNYFAGVNNAEKCAVYLCMHYIKMCRTD